MKGEIGKKDIYTEKAAFTGGPYSQAVIHGDLIYVSGQIALDPDTNEPALGTIEQEATLALHNLRIILEEAGSSMDKVLKVTVYLASMDDYPRFNEVYKGFFSPELPARTCIAAAALPLGAKVEVDAIAYL
ncbi:MAG: hypothetical protein JRJ75_06450 [Deltaproteobacteria bacterium]|nr:hypothetical protein [Deltaproteobacteria bacterium]MBW1928241.1 hypothetical protein [Deltaproteobacteria bacterium]